MMSGMILGPILVSRAKIPIVMLRLGVTMDLVVVVVFVTWVGKIQGAVVRGVMPDDVLVADFVVIVIYTILVTKVVGS